MKKILKKVMIFGTFDILHPGHIEFLRAAKRRGDYLIVSLAREHWIRKIKGRPAVHTETDRKKLLQAVRFVDKVVLGSSKDYISHIVKHSPDIICLGYDQTVFTERLRERLAERGLKVKVERLKPYQERYYKTSRLVF